MTKYLIYTSNPDIQPKGMDDVFKFAKKANKAYFAVVKNGSKLARVKRGDYIVSTKGNNLYILEALEDEDTKLIRSYEEDYCMKSMNIKNPEDVQVVPFEKWCRTANGIAAKLEKLGKTLTTSKNTSMKKNSFSSISDRMKSMLVPEEVENVRIAMDGNICVEVSGKGWVTIGADGKLNAYPEEMTLSGFPVYSVYKQAEQLVPGDIIALDKSYAKVISYNAETGKIRAKSYTGSDKTIYTINDVLLGANGVRVLVSLISSNGGAQGLFGGAQGFNPMAMMLLNKSGKSGNSDMFKFMALSQMTQVGNNTGFNPMMFLLADGDDDSFKDLMMYQMMAGGANGVNPFASMFGNMVSPKAPAAPAEPDVED